MKKSFNISGLFSKWILCLCLIWSANGLAVETHNIYWRAGGGGFTLFPSADEACQSSIPDNNVFEELIYVSDTYYACKYSFTNEQELVYYHHTDIYGIYDRYALYYPDDNTNPNHCVGNPIDPVTGNKYQKESLFKIDSLNPIEFSLYFNSKRTERWRHSYSRSVASSSVNTLSQYHFSENSFNWGPFYHESNGGFSASSSQEVMGKKDTIGTGYIANTRESACTQGWGIYKSRLHYSWIPYSTAEYVNGGKCKILDSEGVQRMLLDIYSLYTGRPAYSDAYASTRYLRFTRENGKVIEFSRAGSGLPWENQPHSGERAEDVYMLGTLSGYRLYTDNDEIEEYDLQGRLLTITSLDGHVQTLTYDPSTNLLSRLQNDTGEYIDFHYESFGDQGQFNRLEFIDDNTGRTWGFRYDSNENLEYVDNADGSMLHFHYEDSNDLHLLTGVTDERGLRYASWTYDATGRATSSSHGPGQDVDRVDIAYSGSNDGIQTVTATRTSSLTGLTTPITSTYTTQAGGGKPLVADISGPGCSSCGASNVHYEQDAETGYALSKEENGIRTEYGNYDDRGNPGYIIEAAGTVDERRKDYTYDPRFHSKVATITEPSVYAGSSKVTTYSYDNYGNTTSITIDGYRPDGTAVSRTTSMQYLGPYHQISQIDGPRSDVSDIISFDYYADTATEGNNRARLRGVSGPDGTAIRSNINYTATGKISNESRANNLYVSYRYYPGNDQLHEMVEQDTVSGLSRTTRWTYLPTGEVESITRGADTVDATTLTLGYDDARRLTRITDGFSNYIEYILDSEGNVEQENYHDASGNLKKNLTQTFDLYNRLDNFSQLNENINSDFNPDGTLDQTTDGKGVVTDYGYDNLLRLTTVTQDLGGTDPTTANALTQYTYDPQDRLTSVLDANGGETRYVYDDLGNLLSQTSPDTGTTVFTHDEAGNIASRTDTKGQLFSYSHDAYNRLTLIDAPGTIDDVQLVYDSCTQGYGRLCQLQRHNSTLAYSYNAFGERTGMEQGLVTWQGYNRADVHVAYGYDSAGRIKTISYPSGMIVTYNYDAAGQVESVEMEQDGTVTALSRNAHYLPFGPFSSQTYGNNMYLLGIYDLAYRPFITGDPQKYYDYIGSYDANGNVTSASSPVENQNYMYDAHNRLDTSSGSIGLFDYDYDPVGNKNSQSIDGATEAFTYEPNSNRMSEPVVLDANGNTTTLRGMTLGYTPDNRLKNVDTGVAFEYDGLGQRVSKKSLAPDPAGAGGWYQTRVYVYGQSGELLAELGPSGKVFKEYIYMNRKPLAMLSYRPDSGENVLHGDMDGDGSISVEDYLVWYFNLFNVGNVGGDVTGDGVLNSDDSTLMVNCAFTQGSCEAASYASSLYYIHNDHLGTPKMLTDSSGAPVWRSVARPFGKATVDDDVDGDGVAVEFNLRQPGQYYDRETGLYYNYFRYYDPQTGRYITSDPIGLKGGINTYSYVGNNPLSFIDPLGLAYFANRPLDGMHGNPNRSPLADWLNIELSHEQLFFEDSKGGNIGFFGDGKVRPDDPKNLNKYWNRRNGGYDDSLMREAVKNVGNPGGYCLVGPGKNNCQDWADKIRDEYEKLKKKRNQCTKP